MSRNIIIFGAGASFGSDLEMTPPLAYNLFDNLCNFNKNGWGQISNKYRSIFRDDFENGMAQFSQDYPNLISVLQRAMAMYFFQFTPRKSNLYYRMACMIKKCKWEGAFITLNYERLLEISLKEADLQPKIGQPTDNNYIELCLPHGCCHLFCESIKADSRRVSFTKIRTSGKIKEITDPNKFYNRINTDAFPPVMSYFEPNKSTTSGINFINEQRSRYEELVRNAEVIAIVGIKVRLHDKHIWQPLIDTNAKIIYCSGSSEKEVFNEWIKNRKDENNTFLSGYFSECFEDICSHLNIF